MDLLCACYIIHISRVLCLIHSYIVSDRARGHMIFVREKAVIRPLMAPFIPVHFQQTNLMVKEPMRIV